LGSSGPVVALGGIDNVVTEGEFVCLVGLGQLRKKGDLKGFIYGK
jgi:hypothetical protein